MKELFVVDEIVKQLSKPVDAAHHAPASLSTRCVLHSVLWFLVSDLAALVAAFFLGGAVAWGLRLAVFNESLDDFLRAVTPEQVGLFFAVGGLSLLWLDTKGHYRQRLPFWESVGNLLCVGFAGLLIGGFVQFAAKNIYSRLWFGCSWGLFVLFLFLGRVLMRMLLTRLGVWRLRSVMIGNGECARSAIAALRADSAMGYDIVCCEQASSLHAFKGPEAWQAFLDSQKVSFLFLALEGEEIQRYAAPIRALARERVPFALIPPWRGLPLSALSTHSLMMHDVLLMHDSNRLVLPLSRLIKRTFDLFAASLAGLVLFPFLLPLAISIRADGGPVLFSQKRVGKDGRQFDFYKFRTMVVGAEDKLEDYLANDPQLAEEWEKNQKLKKDPRITPVGRWLRKSSLDELPQLLNVIKGDMSLVGPRPFLPDQEKFYEDELALYASVRPGLTGPWQVSGRNKLSFDKRVALEAWYARNWTFWLDIVILLKTFPALLKGGKEAF